jgi:hypothetical protein
VTARLAWIWLLAGTLCACLGPLDGIGHGFHVLTDRFSRDQDIPVFAALSAVAIALRLVPGLGRRLEAALRAIAGDRALAVPARPWPLVLALAAAVTAIAWAGCWLVLDAYPLSMDEFMAAFGARILEHGQLAAPVAAPWRPFAAALSPIFAYIGAAGAWWTSGYLPVNSALRAVGGLVRAETVVNPVLAGVSVAATYAIGRRLWPERQDLALVATVLLAASSQFLITAMSAYAMTAHLALNLVWLWLFLRGGRLGHAGAIAVGFLACGLHQLLFHPLFVAPFVLQLLLEKRWRLGGVYILAYAAICLFWVEYNSFAALAFGAPAAGGAAAAAATAAPGFYHHVLAVFAGNDIGFVGLMAKNLLRFVTWQNPLLAPLVIAGAVSAYRAKGAVRSLLLGLVLTVTAMTFVMSYQGHGWGYRYLHGLLGSAALLAARAWGELTADRVDRRGPALAFAALAAVSVFILLPVRALQAHGFVHPYALAHAAIAHDPADVVLVDDLNSWFTADLTRNDPYLGNRPKVMRLADLSGAQIRALCAVHTLDLFTPDEAARLGIWRTHKFDSENVDRRALLSGASCGGRPVGRVGRA